jgi:HlyD family secretion protein
LWRERNVPVSRGVDQIEGTIDRPAIAAMTNFRMRMGLSAAALVVVLHAWPVRVFNDTPDLRIVSAVATAASVPRSLLISGTVQPTSSITVGTTLTGAITSVEASENSVVHKGQVLAHVDAASYQDALAAAHAAFARTQADLRSDQARLDDAERSRSQTAALAPQYSGAPADIQSAGREIERLRETVGVEENRVTDAYAAVSVAMMNLQLTAIRSPVDGIVLSVDRGAAATIDAAGATPGLFRIATDLSHLQVRAVIDPPEAETIRPGDAATIAYQGHTRPGAVLDIHTHAAATAAATTSTLAVVEVENPDGLLRPGMLVTVTLHGSQAATVVRVPNRALSFRPDVGLLQAIGQPHVPIYPAPTAAGAPLAQMWEYNGTEFTAVAVRTGLADEDWTEVVAGAVRPGDRLVTSAELGDAQ